MASVKREWPTYEEAKYLIQRRDVVSREDYWRWYDEMKPQYLPKYPNRVYIAEWVSWNDFLDSTNTFAHMIHNNDNVRGYWDAVRYIRQFKFKTHKNYLVAHREGKLERVPLSPGQFYLEWEGWEAYLGKTTSSVIVTEQNQRPIWALIHIEGEPPNVLWFLKVGSAGELRDKIKSGWTVLAQYWYESSVESAVWDTINNNSAAQYEREQRICSDANQLMWELGNILMFARD